MRRGNLLELRKRDVNLAHKTISVAQTKNGTALVLPLVGEAYELVAERCSHIRDEQHLFPHTPGTQPRHW